jgi:hypothetical protein
MKQGAFHSPLRARRYVMKTVTLAALAVIGAGLAASSTSAAPINPGLAGISPDQSNVIQVNHKKWMGNNWKWRHHRRHFDNDFGFRFGFGVPFVGLGVGAPYYYDRPDCIGWWHRHYHRLHCHGQLVYDY